jgi:hypothetical protein
MSYYRFQLADAKADIGIRNAAGSCPDSEEFADLVNRATRRLMKRGSFFETEVLVKLCVDSCRVVWPRYVDSVRGIRFCCYGQVEVANNWFSIIGAHCGGHAGWLAPVAFSGTTVPCHTEITGNTGHFVRYYHVKNQDVGKTIKIFGTQYGGQPLQELDANGNWVQGITLTAAVGGFVQSSVLVTKITEVVRDVTQGSAFLYQYDATMPGTGLLQLAAFEPNETHPSYRVSYVNGINQIRSGEDANGRKIYTLEAIVKLAYWPVANDRDFLFLGNFDALAFAIQSIKFDEANDPQNAEIYLRKAINDLNFESREKDPGSQFQVQARWMGSCGGVVNPI